MLVASLCLAAGGRGAEDGIMMDLDAEIAHQMVVIRNLRRRLLEAMDEHEALIEKREERARSADQQPAPRRSSDENEADPKTK
jgi:hypothetical protein